MSEPTYAVSCHGTPITQARGRSTPPRIHCNDICGSPTMLPPHPRSALSSATSAMNAINIAATLMASCTPCAAPFAAASITPPSGLPRPALRNFHRPGRGVAVSIAAEASPSPARVSGTSVSGTMILERIKPAGAFITLAASRWLAIPGNQPESIPTYAASTPPATVAKPPTITVLISLLVILPMNGLMRSGDSVCPRKMFPDALNVSAPDVLSVFCITQASDFTISCITPR